MNCIIVDDEPLAREGMEALVDRVPELILTGSFNNAGSARKFLDNNKVDLIFLDINMPGMNGIELAESLSEKTLIIFSTAYAQYALKGYELDAIDYLVKPINTERFNMAIEKAFAYHKLLETDNTKSDIENITSDYIFIKSDRKFFKVFFTEILYIEGLKDYVVIHTAEQKIITAMNIKTIHLQLPPKIFVRINKSYIISILHISSLDNNSVFIGQQEISIGSNYKNFFFDEYVMKKLIRR